MIDENPNTLDVDNYERKLLIQLLNAFARSVDKVVRYDGADRASYPIMFDLAVGILHKLDSQYEAGTET